ncbi:unnamed protein product [Withania somnifera]
MKAQYPSVSFLLLILEMLIVSQLPSCHNIQIIATTSTEQRFKTQFDSSFSTDPKASRNEDSEQNYSVSHHAIPGGPNPLHN